MKPSPTALPTPASLGLRSERLGGFRYVLAPVTAFDHLDSFPDEKEVLRQAAQRRRMSSLRAFDINEACLISEIPLLLALRKPLRKGEGAVVIGAFALSAVGKRNLDGYRELDCLDRLSAFPEIVDEANRLYGTALLEADGTPYRRKPFIEYRNWHAPTPFRGRGPDVDEWPISVPEATIAAA